MYKFSIILATSVVAQKCAELGTEDYLVESGKGVPYVSERGYYRGRETWYWEFGPRSAAVGPSDNPGSVVGTAPIWVPKRADGSQAGDNIIDVLPCEDGYSDLWRVNVINVPDDYVDNTLTSAADVQAAIANNTEGLSVDETENLVNCPVIPFGSTIEDISPGKDDVTLPKEVEGWYQGKRVVYYDFGPVGGTDTEPVWVLQTESGAKEFQGNLIDTVPGGDSGQEPYTPFWQMVVVTVPDSQPDEEDITSAADLEQFPQENMDAIVNCPVSFTAEASTDGGSTGTSPSGAGRLAAGLLAIVASVVSLL